jgi:OHCU decarboxylase
MTTDSTTGPALEARLSRLNALPDEEAAAELRRCCGSTVWAAAMAARRPFGGLDDLRATADEVWAALGRQDRLEALAAHPRIGERQPPPAAAATAAWAAREQASTQAASARTLAELADANQAYEERFGHRFIVCATGKSSDELLGILRQRLGNSAKQELEIAAEEQRKITNLRLEKLLQE